MKKVLLAIIAACVIIIVAQAIQQHKNDITISAEQTSIDSLQQQLGWYEINWSKMTDESN